MKRTTFLFAVVLLALPFNMAFPKTYFPVCRLRFDNQPNGGSIDGTATSDSIGVIVLYKDGTTDSGPIDMSTVSETHDIGLNTPCNTIDRIFLSNWDYNWLWIDQVELITRTGTYSIKGLDNTDGWCISNDPSDGYDSVCDPDGSTPTYIWYF